MSKLIRDPRLQELATLLAITVAWWVITGLALADAELSSYAFLDGSKALFVGMGVLITLRLALRYRRLSRSD